MARFFFEENVTGDSYLEMLQNWLMDELIAHEHEDRTGLRLTGSSPCGLISMTICEKDGSGVLVLKTVCC